MTNQALRLIGKFRKELIEQQILKSYEVHPLLHPYTGEIVHESATFFYKTSHGISGIIVFNDVENVKEIKKTMKKYAKWKKAGFSNEFYRY